MYERRKTSQVKVGNVLIGGDNPIVVQSMANTSTMDTEASVAQSKRIVDAGGQIVRFTTQGQREALNMEIIKQALRNDGYDVPLVADIHFNPAVADTAATICEKVRINPGNYVDPGRKFKHIDYTDEEYAEEIKKIDSRFLPFLNICKQHNTAIRIGVNHGSLSDRIMSRYGDTPEGMVESCMEFLRICVRENFNDVVISIKASNTVVMVTTVRLLVRQMEKENMAFPLHLGVTEAGEGEDGRIKSAVGIGALLCEGIGDTIRVSLSEPPENEIPVARQLIDMTRECASIRQKAIDSISNDKVMVEFHETSWQTLQLKAAMALGAIFIDHKAHELEITNDGFTKEQLQELADSILQAARVKFTKTEFISCPGCGRTLYNLEQTISRIKAAVAEKAKADERWRTLKIGIMGCIVNGPGEMTDADFGYVGAAAGKVSLYQGKQCVEMNIPEDEAVDKLIQLINLKFKNPRNSEENLGSPRIS